MKNQLLWTACDLPSLTALEAAHEAINTWEKKPLSR